MSKSGMTIRLDECTVAALKQLKRQIEYEALRDTPSFTLPQLARHAIRKWCDNQAAPVPLERKHKTTTKEGQQ